MSRKVREYAAELRKKHDELCEYQRSLKKTHERLTRVANSSPCVYHRGVKIGRKLIQRNRRVLEEATRIYNEHQSLDLGGWDG